MGLRACTPLSLMCDFVPTGRRDDLGGFQSVRGMVGTVYEARALETCVGVAAGFSSVDPGAGPCAVRD